MSATTSPHVYRNKSIAAAIVGGAGGGKAYQNAENKKAEKKIDKKALRARREFQQDAAGDREAFKA